MLPLQAQVAGEQEAAHFALAEFGVAGGARLLLQQARTVDAQAPDRTRAELAVQAGANLDTARDALAGIEPALVDEGQLAGGRITNELVLEQVVVRHHGRHVERVDRVLFADLPQVGIGREVAGRLEHHAQAGLLGRFRSQRILAAGERIRIDRLAARHGGVDTADRTGGRVGQVLASVGRLGDAVEQLVERRRAEAFVVRAAEHQLRNRLVAERDLRIGGGAEARVIVAADREGQFQCLGHRHQHLGIHRLDVAANLVERIDVVERRVQDRRTRIGGAAVAVELVLFAAQVGAQRSQHGTGRQLEQLARDRGVELGQGLLAAIHHHARSRGGADRVDRFLALGLARQQERVHDARTEHIGQRLGVVVAGAQRRIRFAEGTRQADAVVVALAEQGQGTVGAHQHAAGLGLGLDLAVAALHAAPAVGNRPAVVGGDAREHRDQLVVDIVVRGAGAWIERRRTEGRGRWRDLVRREALGHFDTRGHAFGEELVLAHAEGGARQRIGVLDRLLQHGGAAGVPGAAIGRAGRIPQFFIIGAHAVDAVAARAARQVEQADAVIGHGAAARDGRAGAVRRQQGRRQGRGEDVAARRTAGIDRHAAIRLEGVHEIALVAAQRLVLAVGGRDQHVPALGVEIAPAAGEGGAADFAAARFGHVGKGLRLQALVVLAQDEVDHAADGVGAVDGRGAVLQHFDPLDRRHRDRVQVDRRTLHAVGRDAAAIEQDQGGVGALAAQVGARGAVIAALGARGDVGVRGQVVGTVAVDVEGGDQLFGRHDALVFKLLARDDLDRQRAFLGDALDARAGDFHPLHRRFRLCLRLCHHRGANAHQGHHPCQFFQFHRVSPNVTLGGLGPDWCAARCSAWPALFVMASSLLALRYVVNPEYAYKFRRCQ